MEAKDFRIKNLVLLKDINEIATIEGITIKGIFYDTNTRSGSCTYDCLEPIPLTEEWLLKCEEFSKTDKDGTPCFFNGDNIMLFDRNGYFDAYLHSELDGSVFFATRLFYVHQFQNFYHSIEKQELTIKK